MGKWKAGTLKSGGSGAPVKSQKQAIAIMLSEKRKAGSNPEYASMKKKSGFPSLIPKSYAKGTSNVGGNWIAGAVNPAHKGYCSPTTKATCTPRRKAFAMRAKKGF